MIRQLKMGSTSDIPTVATPGRMAMRIELDQDDLRLTIDKLKGALEEAKRRVPLSSTPLAPPPTAAMATFSLNAAPRHVASPMPHQSWPGPAQAPLPPLQSFAPYPASQQERVPSWDLCGVTDPDDHSRDPIASMAYTSAISGLPGGGGHAGWLFSASRGLLQLWECSPSGGRGEAPLLMMHSQAIDYVPVCMEVERGTQALLAACLGRSGDEWVALHSLSLETLLAVKARVPMPPQASQRRSGQNCLAATSLHPFGGPLSEHCAAAYGGGIVVWGMGEAARSGAAAAPAVPRAVWEAHDSLITTLHRSSFGLQLVSGAADGGVHLWSLKVRPTAPLLALRHPGRVVGAHQVSDTTLLAAAGDAVAAWDMRHTAQPVATVKVDGKQLTQAAVSPFGDSAAVSTTSGLYCVDLLDPALAVSTIEAAPLPYVATQLAFNAATGEVLVGCADGSLRVYKQRLPYG